MRCVLLVVVLALVALLVIAEEKLAVEDQQQLAALRTIHTEGGSAAALLAVEPRMWEYALTQPGMEAAHGTINDADVERRIAQKVLSVADPEKIPTAYKHFLEVAMLRPLTSPEDRELVRFALQRDQAIGERGGVPRAHDLVGELFAQQPQVKKLLRGGILDMRTAGKKVFGDVDLNVEPPRWRLNAASRSIDDLESIGKHDTRLVIDEHGKLHVIPPLAKQEVQVTGDVHLGESRGDALVLTQGNIATGEGIGARIPKDCPTCKITISPAGAIQVSGTRFPLHSPGRLSTAGTLSGDAILHADYIELVGGASFENNAGAIITTQQNAAYFDDAAKYAAFRSQDHSVIVSDVFRDPKTGVSRNALTVGAAAGNAIGVSYDVSARRAYDQVSLLRSEGSVQVTEFKSGKPSSSFGIRGKEPFIDLDAKLSYGLPEAFVRITGQDHSKDQYLLATSDKAGKSSYAFGYCTPPSCRPEHLVTKGYHSVLDSVLKLQHVPTDPGSRELALSEAGISTTSRTAATEIISAYASQVRGPNPSLSQLRWSMPRILAAQERLIGESFAPDGTLIAPSENIINGFVSAIYAVPEDNPPILVPRSSVNKFISKEADVVLQLLDRADTAGAVDIADAVEQVLARTATSMQSGPRAQLATQVLTDRVVSALARGDVDRARTLSSGVMSAEAFDAVTELLYRAPEVAEGYRTPHGKPPSDAYRHILHILIKHPRAEG